MPHLLKLFSGGLLLSCLLFSVRAAELDAIDAEAQAEVEAALQAADAAPWPDASAAFTDVQTTGAGQWR